jgi:hypothetical protein
MNRMILNTSYKHSGEGYTILTLHNNFSFTEPFLAQMMRDTNDQYAQKQNSPKKFYVGYPVLKFTKLCYAESLFRHVHKIVKSDY